jgi:hypothetical protein
MTKAIIDPQQHLRLIDIMFHLGAIMVQLTRWY